MKSMGRQGNNSSPWKLVKFSVNILIEKNIESTANWLTLGYKITKIKISSSFIIR